jgi:hypothetical protein
MHCGKNHQQSWTGEKSVITPACQNSNVFQWSWTKRFHFDLYIGEDGQNIESRSGYSITIQGLSKSATTDRRRNASHGRGGKDCSKDRMVAVSQRSASRASGLHSPLVRSQQIGAADSYRPIVQKVNLLWSLHSEKWG